MEAALRIIAATLMAATVANLIWGHLFDVALYSGFSVEMFRLWFSTWPYYLLLGLGISATELYLLRRGRRKKARKPWSFDRYLVKDLFACWLTIQYFALIHVFLVPNTQGYGPQIRLFLAGFGVSW